MPESVLESSRVPLGLSPGVLGGAPSGTNLSFAMQHQLQTQWCWAAVTASIAKYYQQTGWSQCKVVNVSRGLSTCCSTGSSSTCNMPWYLDQSLTKTEDLADYLTRHLTWSELRAEINAGRPVGARIGWQTGGGHFLVIDGYSGSGTLDIQDPWFNHSTVNYTDFLTAYLGTGKWTHSYRTKSTVKSVPNPLPVAR